MSLLFFCFGRGAGEGARPSQRFLRAHQVRALRREMPHVAGAQRASGALASFVISLLLAQYEPHNEAHIKLIAPKKRPGAPRPLSRGQVSRQLSPPFALRSLPDRFMGLGKFLGETLVLALKITNLAIYVQIQPPVFSA